MRHGSDEGRGAREALRVAVERVEAREAEVDHLGHHLAPPRAGEVDVLGLDVAVHHPDVVRGRERAHHGQQQVGDARGVEGPLAADEGGQ